MFLLIKTCGLESLTTFDLGTTDSVGPSPRYGSLTEGVENSFPCAAFTPIPPFTMAAAVDQSEPPAEPAEALFTASGPAMVDKAAKIFEHFDKDGDGFLNLLELNALQFATAGTKLTRPQWEAICAAFEATPKGLTVEMLKLTYKTPQANVDADYKKVFQAIGPELAPAPAPAKGGKKS